jgi:hypothetical protein
MKSILKKTAICLLVFSMIITSGLAAPKKEVHAAQGTYGDMEIMGKTEKVQI